MSRVLLSKLNEDLKLAGYKKRTCQSYVRAVRQLRNFWGCDLDEIEEQQVRERTQQQQPTVNQSEAVISKICRAS